MREDDGVGIRDCRDRILRSRLSDLEVENGVLLLDDDDGEAISSVNGSLSDCSSVLVVRTDRDPNWGDMSSIIGLSSSSAC